MRVNFIKTFSSERRCFRKGKEYTVPDAEGQGFINARLAEEVKPTPPAKKPAKAKAE